MSLRAYLYTLQNVGAGKENWHLNSFTPNSGLKKSPKKSNFFL